MYITFQEEYTQIVMGVLENRRQYQSIKRKKETKSEIRFRALLLLLLMPPVVRCSFFFPSHVPNQEYLILKVVCSF